MNKYIEMGIMICMRTILIRLEKKNCAHSAPFSGRSPSCRVAFKKRWKLAEITRFDRAYLLFSNISCSLAILLLVIQTVDMDDSCRVCVVDDGELFDK